MRTVNKVLLIGNITKDASIKVIEDGKKEGGKKIALFTIATNRYYKTSEGEQKSESEFTNCVAWGSLAERCEQFVTKGKLVYAEGRLKTRIIEKEEGERIHKTEVVISNLIFLNKKSDFETIDENIDIKDTNDDDMF